jgi:hypothetical protein
MMKLISVIGFAAISTLSAVPASAAPADAEAIVRKADQSRGGDLNSGLIMQSTITSFKNDQESRSYSIQIEAQDGNSLVTFTEPAYSRGTKMLMRQRNMWFLSSEIKKPVPISPRQRLVGDASNGDIATANFARDYTPKIIGEATVRDELCDVIELMAKNGDATYDRVVYYVSKKSNLGLKAEYYTLSGKLFKTAEMHYDNIVKLSGRSLQFISRMEIHDAVTANNKTVLTYSKPEAKNISNARFDIQSLLSN